MIKLGKLYTLVTQDDELTEILVEDCYHWQDDFWVTEGTIVTVVDKQREEFCVILVQNKIGIVRDSSLKELNHD